jgi:HAD superfamily hydrolase (TIGR01509 family)
VPTKLVIFDCDGVLVDSERLAVRTEAQVLADLGWPLSEAEIIERFVGRSAAHMHREVETAIGRPVDWDTEFTPRHREAFARELKAVPGVEHLITGLTGPSCVASSSSHEHLEFVLTLAGLFDLFPGRIFSATEVAHGKPAPDLFLHAARNMGAAPDACVVIEDSVPGVLAAVAAGMPVLGFAGSVTPGADLARAGATVFHSMEDVPALLATL